MKRMIPRTSPIRFTLSEIEYPIFEVFFFLLFKSSMPDKLHTLNENDYDDALLTVI